MTGKPKDTIGMTASWDEVVEALERKDRKAHRLLERFLDRLQDEDATAAPSDDGARELVRRLVLERDVRLRQQGIRAVGVFGDAEAVPLLADALAADLDFYDHDVIFVAFGEMAERALPYLERVLEEGDESRQCCVAQEVGRLGPAGVPALIQACHRGVFDALIGLMNARDVRAVPCAARSPGGRQNAGAGCCGTRSPRRRRPRRQPAGSWSRSRVLQSRCSSLLVICSRPL